MPLDDQWKSVNKHQPCRVCGKPDWCLVTKDGAVSLCGRVESKHQAESGMWLHFDDTKGEWRPQQKAVPDPVPEINDMGDRQRDFVAALTKNHLDGLSTNLGVEPGYLECLGLGWVGSKHCYSFPMRDPMGNIIGYRLRSRKGQKFALEGSRNGLFDRTFGIDREDHVLVPEGPTDTAACVAFGFNAVGRPSANGCLDMLRSWFGLRDGASAVVVADRDEAGQRGAEKTAEKLAGVCRSVKIIEPPLEHKDIRDWYRTDPDPAKVRERIKYAKELA